MRNSFILVGLLVFLISCADNGRPAKSKEGDSTKPGSSIFEGLGSSSIRLSVDTSTGFPNLVEERVAHMFRALRYAHYVSNGMGVSFVVISENSTQRSSEVSYTHEGTIILSVYAPNVYPISDTTGLRTPAWTDTLSANEMRYGAEFIEAVTHRDDFIKERSLYQYRDGKHLLRMTSDFYGLEHPQGFSRRYLGYFAAPPSPTQQDTFGTLTYVDPITMKKQFVYFKPKFDFSENLHFYRDVKFASLSITGLTKKENATTYDDHGDSSRYGEHWGHSDFKQFDVILNFTSPVKVTIPFRNDSVNISKIHSEWFDLEVVKE